VCRKNRIQNAAYTQYAAMMTIVPMAVR
jgi:hypothetical protein